MKISLVLSTLGRTQPLELFMERLIQQSHRDYELILVDQNDDDRLVPIVERYSPSVRIKHIRSEKGLSLARNNGIHHCEGDLIAFPDDDCWYSPELLLQVVRSFETHPELDGITGVCRDDNRVVLGNPHPNAGYIRKTTVWRRGMSCAIFIRRNVIDTGIRFNVTLGLGAGTPYGSGEDTDFLLQAMDQGFKLYYTPDLVIGHPAHVISYSPQQSQKAFNYGVGIGRVLRINRFPFHYVLYALVRPVGGILVALLRLNRKKAIFYSKSFLGKTKGYLS